MPIHLEIILNEFSLLKESGSIESGPSLNSGIQEASRWLGIWISGIQEVSSPFNIQSGSWSEKSHWNFLEECLLNPVCHLSKLFYTFIEVALIL